MSRGLTIAEFVQQVLYAQYKVLLDVDASLDGAFHSKSDKFREIVMEANFVLQEFQKDQDWNFLRDRWEMGISHNHRHHGRLEIQEFTLPDDVYKVCTGYNDAVRLHVHPNGMSPLQIPFTEARSGNKQVVDMFDALGQANVNKRRQMAFMVGDVLTFSRPWFDFEEHGLLETDVIRRIEPLHMCTKDCEDDCPLAYEEKQFTWMPDPYYFVARTAAKRAEGDPSSMERVQSLTDEATKMLSAIRENDSAHTTVDTYETCEYGYVSVL